MIWFWCWKVKDQDHRINKWIFHTIVRSNITQNKWSEIRKLFKLAVGNDLGILRHSLGVERPRSSLGSWVNSNTAWVRTLWVPSRIASLWNSLPDYVVSSPTTNTFRARLDKFWETKMCDTIGKLIYCSPEVVVKLSWQLIEIFFDLDLWICSAQWIRPASVWSTLLLYLCWRLAHTAGVLTP